MRGSCLSRTGPSIHVPSARLFQWKCERLALTQPVVKDCAPLDVGVGSPRPDGVNRPQARAVLRGIGVDDRAGGTSALGFVHLVAAVRIRIRVAHQHDLPFEIDAHAIEALEILRTAAVRIDDLRTDLARWRIAVKRHIGSICVERRVLVSGERILAEIEREFGGLAHRKLRGLAEAHERRKFMKTHLVDAVFAEAVAHIFGELAVARRARHVRLFRQMQKMFSVGVGIRN